MAHFGTSRDPDVKVGGDRENWNLDELDRNMAGLTDMLPFLQLVRSGLMVLT